MKQYPSYGLGSVTLICGGLIFRKVTHGAPQNAAEIKRHPEVKTFVVAKENPNEAAGASKPASDCFPSIFRAPNANPDITGSGSREVR